MRWTPVRQEAAVVAVHQASDLPAVALAQQKAAVFRSGHLHG